MSFINVLNFYLQTALIRFNFFLICFAFCLVLKNNADNNIFLIYISTAFYRKSMYRKISILCYNKKWRVFTTTKHWAAQFTSELEIEGLQTKTQTTLTYQLVPVIRLKINIRFLNSVMMGICLLLNKAIYQKQSLNPPLPRDWTNKL